MTPGQPSASSPARCPPSSATCPSRFSSRPAQELAATRAFADLDGSLTIVELPCLEAEDVVPALTQIVEHRLARLVHPKPTAERLLSAEALQVLAALYEETGADIRVTLATLQSACEAAHEAGAAQGRPDLGAHRDTRLAPQAQHGGRTRAEIENKHTIPLTTPRFTATLAQGPLSKSPQDKPTKESREP